MRFAARERVRAAFKREVIQPDVVQKLQAQGDFLDDAVGDFALRAGKFERLEIRQRIAQRQMADFVQGTRRIVLAHAHIACGFAQARAVTRGARLDVLQFGQLLADGG